MTSAYKIRFSSMIIKKLFLQEFLKKYTNKNNEIWQKVEIKRHNYFDSNQELPKWCFLPQMAWRELAQKHLNGTSKTRNSEHSLYELQSIASWRYTQGMYEFDKHLYDSLQRTPIHAYIPLTILKSLPEWSLFIKTKNLTLPSSNKEILGFWVSLSYCDITTSEHLLMTFLFDDCSTALARIEINDKLTIHQALSAMTIYHDLPLGGEKALNPISQSLLNSALALVLYICSHYESIRSDSAKQGPAIPTPKKTRRNGVKVFAASGITHWHVAPNETIKNNLSLPPILSHINRPHWIASPSGQLKWLPY